ncbi:PP2C family protein-serine/threonine phosphatase [Streptomyces sp. NPDC020965]|uniref:PP2C family protein-serine/threonine phosphatase n=1 Tax=Streptomyces sp. NPDC020965 TaxID=3365105 RepID=UPI003798E84C
MRNKTTGGRDAVTDPAPVPSYLSRLSRLLPFALIVLGVTFQVVTPAKLNGTPFFVAAPLMAAPLHTRWQTVSFGGVAFAAAAALQVIARVRWERVGPQNLVTQLTTILFATAIAVLLNIVVRRGREELASSREVAEAAQRAVVPSPASLVGGLRVAARYEAAQREALIGGDLYSACSTPHGLRLVMGDVRGKGITAIETVSIVLGAFREASHEERTLPEVAARLEKALDRDRADRDGDHDTETFVTCVLAEIPPGHRVVRVLNCGHPAPLLLAGDGTVTALTPTVFRLPLGLSDLAPSPHRPDVWEFPPDATLLLYTDGLSEARDASGAFYDPQARLAGRHFATPARLLGTLVDDVRRFSGGLTGDDMALLATHRPPSRPARPSRSAE